MSIIEQEIGDLLRKKRMTLGLVESATGGLISHRMTNVPGSSDYYKGSVTAYSNEAKARIVGVSEATIDQHGAVSAQVAEEMAEGGRKLLAADVCLADTGVAGPGGATKEKPVGLFYLGLSIKDKTCSRQYNFTGDREENKRDAAEASLRWLKEYLSGLN
jgi:nicotinamide-nucleotide amidase